jgi:hypothetical protein
VACDSANTCTCRTCRELVLVGGGQAYALPLLDLGKKPLPGVASHCDTTQAAYSEMPSGHIASIYSLAEMHIDLPGLCNFPRPVHPGTSTPARPRTAKGKSHTEASLLADMVSINIGSVPSMKDVAEADIPANAKPADRLLAGWTRVRATVGLSIRP